MTSLHLKLNQLSLTTMSRQLDQAVADAALGHGQTNTSMQEAAQEAAADGRPKSGSRPPELRSSPRPGSGSLSGA